MINNAPTRHELNALHLQQCLLTSSTKKRVNELQIIHEGLNKHETSEESVRLLLRYLARTYPLYIDRASRKAVQQCLRDIVKPGAHNAALEYIINFLQKESTKIGNALSSVFVLVEWCSILVQQLVGDVALWDKWGPRIIDSQARVLEQCLSSNMKRSRKQSAVVITRRAWRAVLKIAGFGPLALKRTLAQLTATGTTNAARNAPLIGLIAGVAARLPNSRLTVESITAEIYDFYLREIIGAKTTVLPHLACGLLDFFKEFATAKDVHEKIIVVASKALLRSPEVVLDGVLDCFLRSLPTNLDLSDSLQGQLLKPLLSSVKSTSTVIREGASNTFQALVLHAKSADALMAASMELLKWIRDAKSIDHRNMYCSMLASIPASPIISPEILSPVAGLASKETNDTSMRLQLASVRKHTSKLLSIGRPLASSALEAFIQGVADKKTSTRNNWAITFGEILSDLSEDSLRQDALEQLVEPSLGSLQKIWTEVCSNQVGSGHSGLFAVGCVMVVLGLQKLTQMESKKVSEFLSEINIKSVVNTPSPRLFSALNSKAYTRVSTEEDVSWLIRALDACATGGILSEVSAHVQDAWAQAAVFVSAISCASADVRAQAHEMLSRACSRSTAPVQKLLIRALWHWLEWSILEGKDAPASLTKINRSRLHLVVKSLCIFSQNTLLPQQRPSGSILKETLLDLHIISRQPLMSRCSWINLCLDTGVDPAQLVSENMQELLQRIVMRTLEQSTAFTRATFAAACDAAAEMAFIAPLTANMPIEKLIKTNLNPSQLDSIGPTEAGIFRTPQGVTFVDVLTQKINTAPIKNAKDYDLLKWEQDLRAQLDSKYSKQKQLTREEQAKVDAQLEREAAIRAEVAAVVTRLRRGIGLIDALVRGPPTDYESWMGQAADHLFHVIDKGAGMLVGDSAALTYLALSDKVSLRLGTLRPFIGVATLRAQGTSHLPTALLQEPLGDLVTRVLYRLKFGGEQHSFDVTSLSYLLPLIVIVIDHAGLDRTDSEGADEQITLALEFLVAHAEVFSSQHLPRAAVCALLVRSMQTFKQHYRLIKDCLMGICRAFAPNASEMETKVFLQGAIVPEPSVRGACLQAIDAELELPTETFCVEVWLACHELDEENASTAEAIWKENALSVKRDSGQRIIPFLKSNDTSLRVAAARSLAACLAQHRQEFGNILFSLQESYLEQSKARVPQRDQYGMPVKTDLNDPWESRQGIAGAFKELCLNFPSDAVTKFVTFLVERGPFSDKSPAVRNAMIAAATNLIAIKGAANLEDLIKLFETCLESSDSSESQDLINEAVVILYGALGRHLKAGDARINKVIDRLLVTLSTPSENVQFAIAECLPPLLQTSSVQSSQYSGRLMDELLHGKKYAGRRGAAYGLAGVVSGKGIGSLRDFRILSSLKSATEDKKDSIRRQGAFLAFELLSLMLGTIFEPYVVQIVPQLLTGFGDASTDVRDSCLDAAKTCFATLSSFGVKQILPILLEGLEEVQWRSKKGACDSLGAMAYLAPQQLAMSLPEIIPPLTTVLNDSHKEVRGAANRSLKRFGEVITNPEIKSLVDVLLKALSDPTKFTDEALDALLKINFTHYLDAPSLALVVRILERGLGERSNTKRKASQIIGSLAHLADRKDLSAHLPKLVAGLRVAAVDPVPATRATSSKALGSLVEKLGEDALPDLIPSLMATLKTEAGAGDRLGSAQALSEVLAGLGTSRLEETLPSILQNVTSSKASVREGFMSLFIFLPACFGNSFANYLNRVIPPILAGLADEIESIRDTSLRAGRLLVKNFATKAIDLLLPELIRGMADDSHRIRLSSVELVGDLLFNLTGINALTHDEDTEDGAASAGQSLLDILGEEKRNAVLSALYISRSDTSGLVRTASIQVWKALVATPRTLREITATLTQMLIRRLASSNMEQKIIAGNALGELIRKAGESVLATLLPTLEASLETAVDAGSKQGICIALKELINSASPENLEDHETKLITIVRSALLDHNSEVRDAAAEAFDSLQRLFGKRIVDQVLPNLLALLRQEEEATNSLAALLTLLEEPARSSVILPNLLPTLLQSPISAFNAKALASLASVSGSAITRRLSNILHSLMDNIVICKDQDRLEALNTAFDSVMLSVDEFDGLNILMSVMLSLSKHDDHRRRKLADERLSNFFNEAQELDYSRYHADLIRALLISFDDSDQDVVKAAWAAMSALVSKMGKGELESLVPSTRQALGNVGVAGHDLPGFCLPKGIGAVLPIFLQGLINGPPEQRTQAALAISDIIDRTSHEALKPYVAHITGPLIRVVSERSVEVRSAIMLTLNNLLEKIPMFVKPFLPQLQRSFTKALADTSSEVLRVRAAKALGTLITLTPRIDPLIGELVAGSRTTDTGVSDAMQKALYEVVSKVGANMSENSQSAILSLVDDDLHEFSAESAIVNARLLGALVKNLTPHVAANIVKTRACTSNYTRASVLAMNAILLDSPRTLTDSFNSETVAIINGGIGNPDAFISENCVLASGKYLLTSSSNKSFDVTREFIEALVPVMQPGSPIDARRLALVVIRTISRENNDIIRPHIAALAPVVFANVREMIIPIKLAAEAAFLSIFSVVQEDGAVFERFMTGPGAELSPSMKRSMQDYFKRVALRLAGQAQERQVAEGGQSGLGLSNDERDDEKEIWSVGKMDLSEVVSEL